MSGRRQERPAPPSARAKAVVDALTEKKLVPEGFLESVRERAAEDWSPKNGARVVARAWVDPEYRTRLLADGTKACAELGYAGPQGEYIVVLEDTPALHNVIVCTQCSCTAWPVLGLPPDWYKSPEYRARVVREPRRVLHEMGLDLPESVPLTTFPWFIRRAGVHIEHGHFYDPDNAPNHPLSQWDHRTEPLGVALTRRFIAPNGAMMFAGAYQVTPMAGFMQVLSEYRLRAPLVRRDGRHLEVSWDEAWDEIDRRLPPLLERHGRDAAAIVLGNPTAHKIGLLLYGAVGLAARWWAPWADTA